MVGVFERKYPDEGLPLCTVFIAKRTEKIFIKFISFCTVIPLTNLAKSV